MDDQIINGGAATAVLAYLGAHSVSGPGKSATILTIVLYCLGVFTAMFAGLYIRRTTQELSSFWELKSYPAISEREKVMEGHRQQAIRSKRWSTGLLVFSEVFFSSRQFMFGNVLGIARWIAVICCSSLLVRLTSRHISIATSDPAAP